MSETSGDVNIHHFYRMAHGAQMSFNQRSAKGTFNGWDCHGGSLLGAINQKTLGRLANVWSLAPTRAFGKLSPVKPTAPLESGTWETAHVYSMDMYHPSYARDPIGVAIEVHIAVKNHPVPWMLQHVYTAPWILWDMFKWLQESKRASKPSS